VVAKQPQQAVPCVRSGPIMTSRNTRNTVWASTTFAATPLIPRTGHGAFQQIRKMDSSSSKEGMSAREVKETWARRRACLTAQKRAENIPRTLSTVKVAKRASAIVKFPANINADKLGTARMTYTSTRGNMLPVALPYPLLNHYM